MRGCVDDMCGWVGFGVQVRGWVGDQVGGCGRIGVFLFFCDFARRLFFRGA